jgi:murein L,D-transpeptidase YcbB/YkuD
MPRHLRIAHTGPDVKVLQTSLKTLGLYTADVSGVFGPRTRTAVLAFQKQAGLVQDCVVGPLTQAAIDAALKKAALDLADALATQPATANDPGGPYLLFDLYPFDLDDPKTKKLDNPDFKKVFGKPNMRARFSSSQMRR